MKYITTITFTTLALFMTHCTSTNTSQPDQETRQMVHKPTETKILKRQETQDPTESHKPITSGSHFTMDDVQEMLDLHNKARAEVGVGSVSWSSQIAKYAQIWANNLAQTGCQMQHRSQSQYGENLFMGTAGYYGVGDAAKSWESEKVHYQGQTLNNSNWYTSGHYTQMVWKNTQQIGCGKITCGGQMIVVCNYNPPGNFMGQKPY